MAKRIRLGLVGASVESAWSARAHFPALACSPDFELTAVCTTKPESAEAMRQRYGARLAFHDFRAMAASPEIDAVAVVVRVPSHFEPTKAALEAGKHVLTEWPLGRTTREAEDLTALAKARGVQTAVGLQAHLSPPLMYMKDLIETGHIGEVMACHVSLFRDGVLERQSNRAWMWDAELGATTLTIATGHTIDALRFVAGDFARLTSIVATQARQWFLTDTRQTVDVTAPDNVLVSGRLANGAVASLHVASIPWAGSGYRMEIYGRQGTLVASGLDSPQLSEVRLHGARGGAKLTEMEPPARFIHVDPAMPRGAPYNIGQLYAMFAQSIRANQSIRTNRAQHPTFDTAVDLHHFVDTIKRASDRGCEEGA
ncbi:MAG: Gfo/Idh/MocA family oxidoreductase [Alphaproteobacteria bacterium]